MEIMLRGVGLALVVLSVCGAEDTAFDKVALFGTAGGKPTPITLIVSDVGLTIRSNDQKASVLLDLPFTSINRLGYSFLDQRRTALMPLIGVSALFMKGQSHWLLIESGSGAVNSTTVMRLDKTEYRSIIAAITAKSGKHVEMLAPGSTLIDPTAGSHDEDGTVPFQVDQVSAALKLAMEQYSCKVGKSKADRIECNRGLRPPGALGGGEAVTAVLESKGSETHVLIKTEKGFGKDWSRPIYLAMLQKLEPTH